MARVLMTAFEPFGGLRENASRLCLEQIRRLSPTCCELETAVYPVHFELARERLERDLESGAFTAAIHLGQAEGSAELRLEAVALNLGGEPHEPPDAWRALVPNGPEAYFSPLPLGDWAARLAALGVPARVSHHAGTYLCNATLYWSRRWAALGGADFSSLFVHLPLAPEQSDADASAPRLDSALAARGVAALLQWLVMAPRS